MTRPLDRLLNPAWWWRQIHSAADWLVDRAICKIRGHHPIRIFDEIKPIGSAPMPDPMAMISLHFEVKRQHFECRRCRQAAPPGAMPPGWRGERVRW